MIVDFSIPVASRLYMETYKLPLIDRLLLFFNAKSIYEDIAIKSVGYKDLVFSKEIEIDENFKEKDIKQLVSLLSFVSSKIERANSNKFTEIAHSIDLSIKALEQIIDFAESKHKYNQMKKDMAAASSQAILSNINKYK